MPARHARLVLVLVALAAILALPAAAEATTPGPNGRIAFSSTRYPADNPELYSMLPDGTGVVRLTFSETSEQHPTWSPDGTQIAFGSFADGRQSIHVMDADGARERRLSPDGYDSDDMEPAWSPDGSKIVFASTRPYNGAWRIWVMDAADGSGLRQLVDGFGTSPAWSPDGTRIAYVGLGGQISIADADGTRYNGLTRPPGGYTDERPSWSPDGTRLVFSRRLTFGDEAQLYVIGADGQNERQLTTAEGASRFPSWSPDGEQIVFTHMARLSVINPNGSGMRPIAGEPWGTDLTPDWGSSIVAPDPQAPGAPTIEIYSPEAQLYPAGYPLQAVYRCYSETSFVVSCEGDVPLGELVDTSTAGTHTFTVRATDLAGRTSSATVTYEVLDFLPPEILTSAPGDGSEYEVGAAVEVDFECRDEPGGSGVVLCDAELQDGQPLDTSRAGTFSASFWAVDAAGNVAEKRISWTVADRTPPTVTIVAPQEGTSYVLGSTFTPLFTCSEGAVVCRVDRIDTSTVGSKTFTVTAEDASGNVATATRGYRVVYPFSGFAAPIGTSTPLRAGDTVPAKFSLGGDYGLGVVSSASWRPCGSGGRDGAPGGEPATGRLSYRGDRYSYLAESSAAWAGTCRQLALTLDDGTTHVANVMFG